MLIEGIKGRQKMTVDQASTAKAMGSGTLDVLATPALIALMEKTAWMSVAKDVESGWSTVGVRLSVRHLAPTPVNSSVVCESALISVNKKRLIFEIKVFDQSGLVGEGEHERVLVEENSFMRRVSERTAAEDPV